MFQVLLDLKQLVVQPNFILLISAFVLMFRIFCLLVHS